MIIENPTLAHFRHFSSLFTPSPLYICREPSTNHPFLCKTNPILSAVGGLQMNVSIYLQTDYENKYNWTLGESKPNQSQFKPIKPNLVRRRRIPKGQNEQKIACRIKLDFSNNDIRIPNRKTKISNSVSENKVKNDCKNGHTQRRIGFGN